MTSLNPVYTVGAQIAEAVREHDGLGRRAALERAVEMLQLVHIPNPRRRVDDYPHQFSGGMRQRVMIAMALVVQPEALDRRRADDGARCDDPGADPRPARRDESEIRHGDHADHARDGGRRRDGAAGRRHVCRQGGRGGAGRGIVRAAASPLYAGADPLDPAPRPGRAARRGSQPIPGVVPSLVEPPPGCRFAPRCGFAMPACTAAARRGCARSRRATRWRASCERHPSQPKRPQRSAARCCGSRNLVKNFPIKRAV